MTVNIDSTAAGVLVGLASSSMLALLNMIVKVGRMQNQIETMWNAYIKRQPNERAGD